MPKRLDSKFRAPKAFKLLHSLQGHKGPICAATWTSDGLRLLTASCDRSIILWDSETQQPLYEFRDHHDIVTDVAIVKGDTLAVSCSDDQRLIIWDLACFAKVKELIGHEGHVNSIAVTPEGDQVLSASDDMTIKQWNIRDGVLVRTFAGHESIVYSVAVTPDGRHIVSASRDQTVRVWNLSTGALVHTLAGHGRDVNAVIVSPDGRRIISAGDDRTARVWDIEGRLLRILEGHTDYVMGLAISHDGHFLASKSHDDTVRIWTCRNWQESTVIDCHSGTQWPVALAFHPFLPKLAMLGERKSILNVWEIDRTELEDVRSKKAVGSPDLLSTGTDTYSCAKVVLLGDTGVGKTGLRLVLSGLDWEKTETSHARKVDLFDRQELRDTRDGGDHRETHDVWLWDLAGQPGYRLIHQLHLNEVAIALIVFDSRNETDPFAGVIHWDRALRQAQRLQSENKIGGVKKFLVAARTDREGISVSRRRIDLLMQELGIDGYFETSAKEGWQVRELSAAIRASIDWDSLPKITSTGFLHQIRNFLENTVSTRQVMASTADLFSAFLGHKKLPANESARIWRQFETCLGHVETQGLLRRLSFGNLILLRPELLDAYASSLINAAKAEPEGTGAIAEDIARSGRFWMSDEDRIADREQEKLLIIATVEDLVRHELALREHTESGPFLVFPSQYTRESPEAPDPEGKAVVFSFEGPLSNIYTTLVVRLSRSQFFTKDGLWKNAATYRTQSGGLCGLYFREIEEGRGELVVFYKAVTNDDIRSYFEGFVRAHLERRALSGTVICRHHLVCPECSTPVADIAVKRRLERAPADFIVCNVCDTRIPLRFRDERPREVLDVVRDMQLSADEERDRVVTVTSASGETGTDQFEKWAGSREVLLAIAYTIFVDHTQLTREVGLAKMGQVHRSHLKRAQSLVEGLDGYMIKSMQHAAIYAFRSAARAVDFARLLRREPVDLRLQLRVAIDVGTTRIEEGEPLGLSVDFVAAVSHEAKKDGIWISDRAKIDLDELKANEHGTLCWLEHPDCQLTGFPRKYRLWHLESEGSPKPRQDEGADANFLTSFPNLMELDGYTTPELGRIISTLCKTLSARAQGHPLLDESRFKSTKRPGKLNAIKLLAYFGRNIDELSKIARDSKIVKSEIQRGTFGRNHVHRETGISTGGIVSNPAWDWLMNSVFNIEQRQRTAHAGADRADPYADVREESASDNLERREEAHLFLDEMESAGSISSAELEKLRAWVDERGGVVLEDIRSYFKDKD